MNILAYVTPVKEEGKEYLCFVEGLEGYNKKYHTKYDRKYFDDCPFGSTLAFMHTDGTGEPELLRPDRQVLKEFGCSFTYCVTYNFFTHDVLTVDGEVYNLWDCMYAKHNRQTIISMLNALRNCENVNIQLILKMGKVLDVGVYLNKQPGDMNYETSMQLGLVSINKEILRKVSNLHHIERSSREVMTQKEIDNMLKDLT